MTPELKATIARALGETLGGAVEITEHRAVGGGCINHGARLATTDGTFFVKWNALDAIPDQFEREAEGLAALAAAAPSLAVPRPICHRRAADRQPAFLVLEYLPPGRRVADFDDLLGAGLAELHRASADRFGFAHDNYCGATPQPNGWLDDWITFYRARRLGFQLELALTRRRVPASDRRRYEQLLDRLGELLATDPEPPALIHGDLWSGNLHVAPDGRPGLIDPAAYYGHREAELGMMVLFGGFSRQVFDAYHAAYPLQPGWEHRIELYTLYHVMNHFNLFGGGYGTQAFDIVRRWVG